MNGEAGGEPMVTLNLSLQDWQLVQQVLQQALLPYQRVGQVVQAMQHQAQRQLMPMADQNVQAPAARQPNWQAQPQPRVAGMPEEIAS
jgi:hypothetical protein